MSSLRNDKYLSGSSSGNYNAPYYLSSNVSWATVSGTSVVVSKNTGSSSRTATITVTQYNGGKSTTYTITQAAAIVQSDLYISCRATATSGNKIELSVYAAKAVTSDLCITFELDAEFKYGGGGTKGTAEVYLPSGSNQESAIYSASDIFGEAIHADTLCIIDTYVDPEEDAYYRYYASW